MSAPIKFGVVMALASSQPYGVDGSVAWSHGIQPTVWKAGLTDLNLDYVRMSVKGDSTLSQITSAMGSINEAGCLVLPTVTFFNSGAYNAGSNIYGLNGYGTNTTIIAKNRDFCAQWVDDIKDYCDHIYVIGNERDSFALASGNGSSASHYTVARAEEAYSELYGGYLGMKDADPLGIAVCPISWSMRTGLWDYFHTKGFEDFVCSVHQYYDPLTSHANGSGSYVNQAAVLANYKKPSLNNGYLMMTEINRQYGSGNSDSSVHTLYSLESSYMELELDRICSLNLFNIVIAYEWYDYSGAGNGLQDYGLIKTRTDGTDWFEAGKKTAYTDYKRVIGRYQKGNVRRNSPFAVA